jgi:hypothetical protein
MTTPSHPEWAGLEEFVSALRRLDAPAARTDTAPIVRAPTLVTPRVASRAAWPWRAGLLAAGLAAILVIRGQREGAPANASPTRSAPTAAASSATAAPRAADPTDGMRAFLSPWPAVALAQSAPNAPKFVAYAPLGTLDPTRLKPGHRTYVRMSANDYHESLPHEVWTNDLDTVRYQGVAAWRLVRRVERYDLRGQPQRFVDTLWMRATDLRPLARRVSHAGTVTQRFSYTDSSFTELDSVFIPKLPASERSTRSTPRARPILRRVIALSREHRYIVNSEYLRVLLRAAPLSLTWRASVQVEQRPYNQPENAGFVNLRVTGVDTVQHFNGRFPVWRVAVEGTMRPETWLVSQQTGETLVTDGPLSTSYPESRTMLLYGLEETTRLPPVRRR